MPKSYADLAQPRWKGRLGIEAEDEDWFAMVITDLGEEHGHRVLRVTGKGAKMVLTHLPPAVGRAIDHAIVNDISLTIAEEAATTRYRKGRCRYERHVR